MTEALKEKLRKITPYVPGEQSKESGIIKLNANENPYPPSPQAAAVLKNFAPDTLRLYPDSGAGVLKEAIAAFYGVKAENVFVANGSDDVIALAFQAFFCSEKPILFPDITYSFYPVWCDLFQIPYKTIPLDENFRIDPQDYSGASGGIVIANPNAPTSIGEGEAFVRRILTQNTDAVVMVDEAYADFSEYSAVGLTREFDNLVVTGTFSKSRSLAGLRIGFAVANPELIAILEAVKNSYNSYCVNSVSMLAGAASIADKDYFYETVAKVKATREKTAAALRALGFTVADSGTNFLFVTKDDSDMKAMFEYLKGKKVFIRYFDLPRIDNHVRITIGTDEEMEILLTHIRTFLSEQA